MSYTSVQFIAYEVPTGVALPAGKCGVDQLQLCKDLVKEAAFTSALGALSEDARARVSRLLAIVDLARSSMATSQSTETLKVFVAPEFYLRPREQGQLSRSYASSDLVAAQSVFRQVFAQVRLQGWLCVLGTMIWNMKGTVAYSGALSGGGVSQKDLEGLSKLDGKDVVYNSALVAIGGAGVQVYDKVYYSGADDISDKRYPLQGYTMRSTAQCVVAADNLQCGLEVCRDHQQRFLGKAFDDLRKSQTVDKNAIRKLDLQLLTACGMTVQKSSVILGPQRYLFRVDGAVSEDIDGNGRFDHSELQLVTAGDVRGATQIVNATTDSRQWQALNKPNLAIDLADDLRLDVTGAKGAVLRKGRESWDYEEKDLDEVFKQRLVIYKSLPLAHLAS